MFEISYNKKIKMVYIEEIKGKSQYGNNYHFIKLLKVENKDQYNKLIGKSFDCFPYNTNTDNFECGDIVEVIFDNHSPRKNLQIHDLQKTGQNIFKSTKYNDLINQNDDILKKNNKIT